MHVVNIVANLSLAAVLLGCGVITLYYIRAIHNGLDKKTKKSTALAWLGAIITIVTFSSMAIQTASLWDTTRYATGVASQ